MPKGPNGQKRPADAIGLAVMVGRIATGEIEDNPTSAKRVSEVRAEAGSKGGKTRAERLTPTRRTEVATRAANTRWKADIGEDPSLPSENPAARGPQKDPA
jgi:hypothetical protein